MRKGFANSISSRWNTDASELTFKIFKGEVDLSPSYFFNRPPRSVLREHTYRLLQGPNSGAFPVRVGKYWSRLLPPLVMSVFKKNVLAVNGAKYFLQHLCNFLFPFTDIFLHLYCNPRLFMFHLPPKYPAINE